MIEIGSLDDATILHLSKKQYGNEKFSISRLATHFKVSEFACKDGSDEVLVCVKLVKLLEQLRLLTNQPVHINSGFRTAAYNAKIGGAKKSQHVLGKAADITVGTGHNNVAGSVKCAILAAELGFTGIGTYPTFTHVDVRDTKSFFDYTGQNTIWANEFAYKKG